MADRSSRTAGGSRRGIFTLFRGENVPAEVMGPRLLVAVCAIALTIIGIVMVYSASSIEAISESNDATYYVIRQVAFALIGGGAAFTCVRFVPYHQWLGTIGFGYYVVCMILVVLTAAMGLVGLGAQRWLSIGGVTLQPSEFAKIALLLATTRFMMEYRNGEVRSSQFALRMFLFVVLPLGFIFRAQSDLGTTVICLVGILTILWVGGLPKWLVFVIICACAVFAMIASTSGYRHDRWIYLNPWSDYYGSGFQIIHSFYAFAQGGFFGQGLGNSAEKYLYLPEAETDFIFSIIGEELGFIGAVIVIGLFLGFLVGGLRMAQNAPDDAGTALCAGLSVMLVFQALLNIGMCIGVFPTTGKPLPFISAGGSSLIASLIIVGIMLSVSYATDESVYERRRTNLRLLRVEDEGDPGIRTSHDRGRFPSDQTGRASFPNVVHGLFGSDRSHPSRGDERVRTNTRAGEWSNERREYRDEGSRRADRTTRGRGRDLDQHTTDRTMNRTARQATSRASGRTAGRSDGRSAASRDSRHSHRSDDRWRDERPNRRESGVPERRDNSLNIVNDYHIPNRRRPSGSSSDPNGRRRR